MFGIIVIGIFLFVVTMSFAKNDKQKNSNNLSMNEGNDNKKPPKRGGGGFLSGIVKIILGIYVLGVIGSILENDAFKDNAKEILLGILVISIVAIILIIQDNRKLKRTMEAMKTYTDGVEQWKKHMNEKFGGIIDLEDEKEKLNSTLISLKAEIKSSEEKKELLNSQCGKIEKEIKLLSDENELLEFGYYKFKYNYEKSARYNEEFERVKTKQKEMLKMKTAATCTTSWTVGESAAKGKTLTANILKLTLRAFNGECDSAIAKVKYNNVNTMEARINRSYEAINKMVSYFHCSIDSKYLKLKLEELYLTYEYYRVLEDEKEEQRRIKEEMREEERAQREFERAQLEAQKEEERARKALEKAEEKLKNAHGEEINKMNEQIEKLRAALEEAQKNQERAKSMAQMTKSGYVYVISNIGSFGENVYKIGMTRRLEPMDRVRELGDASVPFNFDVHAMIYTENAPELENALHREFYDYRVNKINDRREFFRVNLEDVKKVAEKYKADVKFTMIAEAQQYRQTLAMEREMGMRQ